MSEDFGKQTAAPSHIILDGVTYRVRKQGPSVWGELEQFLKSCVPDPRLKAAQILKEIPPDNPVLKDVALKIWQDFSEEAKDWPPALDSFEGNLILCTTHEGATAVVWALLRKHTPGLTMERARDIADGMSSAEINELIRLSMPEPTFNPKPPSPATTTETTDRGPVPA